MLHSMLESMDNWFFQLAVEKAAMIFVLVSLLLLCTLYLMCDKLIRSVTNYYRRSRLESADEFEYMNDLY